MKKRYNGCYVFSINKVMSKTAQKDSWENNTDIKENNQQTNTIIEPNAVEIMNFDFDKVREMDKLKSVGLTNLELLKILHVRAFDTGNHNLFKKMKGAILDANFVEKPTFVKKENNYKKNNFGFDKKPYNGEEREYKPRYNTKYNSVKHYKKCIFPNIIWK